MVCLKMESLAKKKKKLNLNLNFINCITKNKDTMMKGKDTQIINLHHQICSKYFRLNHSSIVHEFAYHEDHSGWEIRDT